MQNPFAGRPVVRTTPGEGSQAKHHERDKARGLTPGDGLGGTAGLVPGDRAAVAAAAKRGRANPAPDHVDLEKGLPRIKRV
jgi:hypothetical protein